VTSPAEALPDDPAMLEAMLLAEREESERLRQIIKELQRHRFGRRAESVPREQCREVGIGHALISFPASLARLEQVSPEF